MKDDDFTKLFKYMTDRFDKLENILDVKANNEDIQAVLRTLDSLAKRKKYPMTNA